MCCDNGAVAKISFLARGLRIPHVSVALVLHVQYAPSISSPAHTYPPHPVIALQTFLVLINFLYPRLHPARDFFPPALPLNPIMTPSNSVDAADGNQPSEDVAERTDTGASTANKVCSEDLRTLDRPALGFDFVGTFLRLAAALTPDPLCASYADPVFHIFGGYMSREEKARFVRFIRYRDDKGSRVTLADAVVCVLPGADPSSMVIDADAHTASDGCWEALTKLDRTALGDDFVPAFLRLANAATPQPLAASFEDRVFKIFRTYMTTAEKERLLGVMRYRESEGTSVVLADAVVCVVIWRDSSSQPRCSNVNGPAVGTSETVGNQHGKLDGATRNFTEQAAHDLADGRVEQGGSSPSMGTMDDVQSNGSAHTPIDVWLHRNGANSC
jgi:hypothetical protein